MGDVAKTFEQLGNQARVASEIGLTPWVIVLLGAVLLLTLSAFYRILTTVVKNAQLSSDKERELFSESLQNLQETFKEGIESVTTEMKYTHNKLSNLSDRISRVEATLHLPALAKRDTDSLKGLEK